MGPQYGPSIPFFVMGFYLGPLRSHPLGLGPRFKDSLRDPQRYEYDSPLSSEGSEVWAPICIVYVKGYITREPN